MRQTLLYLIITLCTVLQLKAQDAQFPIVKGFGGIYHIEDAVEQLDPNKKVKILIDLVSPHDSPEEFSFWINNIARAMNLHGIQGLTNEQLEVKVIVHSKAVFDILSDATYQEKFEVEGNPNIPVLNALHEAGAQVIVCGQSLIARKLTKDDLWEHTQVATSALTTITKNVAAGFVVLKF